MPSPKGTPVGVVTTFAGQLGVPGLVNDTGTSAQFGRPAGWRLTPHGNRYVATRA